MRVNQHNRYCAACLTRLEPPEREYCALHVAYLRRSEAMWQDRRDEQRYHEAQLAKERAA